MVGQPGALVDPIGLNARCSRGNGSLGDTNVRLSIIAGSVTWVWWEPNVRNGQAEDEGSW